MTTADPTVYLVEDDEAMRDALSLVLRAGGIAPCSYPSAEVFLGAYRRHEPGCLIVDVSLPGISGLELQQRMLAEDETMPVIFISGCGDVPLAAKAFKAGAVDFIEKPVADHHLLAAVDEAMALARELGRERAETLRLQDRFNSLTRRERDVMVRVVAGATNKAVANELRISPRTVEIYRRRVMEKMDVPTLADLVRVAALVGLPSSFARTGCRPARRFHRREAVSSGPPAGGSTGAESESAGVRNIIASVRESL